VAFSNDHVLLSRNTGSVSPCDGGTTDANHFDFYLNMIPKSQSSPKVNLEMYCWKSYSMFAQDRCIFNSKLIAEEFLERNVKVMKESGVIDNSRIVDVTKANLQVGSKCHFPYSSKAEHFHASGGSGVIDRTQWALIN